MTLKEMVELAQKQSQALCLLSNAKTILERVYYQQTSRNDNSIQRWLQDFEDYFKGE